MFRKQWKQYLWLPVIAALLVAGCSVPTDPDDDDGGGGGGGTVTHTDNITTNTTWAAGQVHIVESGITISNATLTIEPGAVIRMAENTSITVSTGGGLIADGTDSVITITGTTAQKGWWNIIKFSDNSVDANCRLTHCIIEYGGGYYAGYGMIYCDKASPSIDSCIIRNSNDLGVVFYYTGAASFTGNVVTLNTKAPVNVNFQYAGTIGRGAYSGNTDDHIVVENATLAADATWLRQDIPYLLENGTITSGTLTISPGTVIHMAADAMLEVGTSGGLIADGTDSVITITGSTAQKGWWNIIKFSDNSIDANCRLTHCIIEYGGGYYAGYGMVYCDKASPSIDSCTIRSSNDYGVVFYYAGASSFSGNVMTLNTKAPININFKHAGTIGQGAYSGNTDDHIVVENATLEADATWLRQDVPYLLEDGTITSGTLTINPGTVIHMAADAMLEVGTGGGLIADGTDSLITFTGATAQKGWWNIIKFAASSIDANCQLINCLIEYGGGYYADYGMIYCDHSGPTITDCTVQHSDDYGIVSWDGTPVITNVTYNDNTRGNYYSN